MHVLGDLIKADDLGDGTVAIKGVMRPEVAGSGERITAAAIRNALPGFMRAGAGSLRDGSVAAGAIDDVDIDDVSGTITVRGTVVDPVSVAKVQAGRVKGLR